MNKEVTKPVVLVVLDGWGIREETEHNGIALADTPNFDTLWKTYPHTTLQASGEHVGLPDGQMGNSEVGHMTIGAGTVLYQDLVRIGKDISCGKFEDNTALQQAFTHAKKHESQLHIMGLLSCGGVHAHEDHFFATIEAAVKNGVKTIILHAFLDGRDCSRTEGKNSLAKLESLVDSLGVGAIATIAGRYYAMDRDNNWDRTNAAFDAIWHGKAQRHCEPSDNPSSVASACYIKEEYDELMPPYVVKKADNSVYTVNHNDAIIFTNFRPDRARQLSEKIGEHVLDENLCFVTMTDYGVKCNNIVAYAPEKIDVALVDVVERANMKQAHIAETEKYAHATYFLNGGKEAPHVGEEHVLIQSNKDIKTHDEKPEMKAKEICDAAISRLETNDFIFINFANPDMVGHTANQKAIITAVETVDYELGRLAEAVRKADGSLLAIADHGNAETMIDPKTGEAHTSHTTNVVPCILISEAHRQVSLTSGGLKDVAPTVLDLLKLEKPQSMSGNSLIQ